MHDVNWMRWAIALTGSIVNIALFLIAPPVCAGEGSEGVEKLRNIDLSTLPQPARTVDEWMQQMAQLLVQVTGVQVNPTQNGIEVVLETTDEQLATPATSVVGNALIAYIPNAVLVLPKGEEFQIANPAEGIALVTVTPRGDEVRVAITGIDAPPTAEVRSFEQRLLLSVTPGSGDAAETDDDAIQIFVTGERDEGYYVPDASTATRTDTPLRDIPQSIQVIPRQVIEDQQVVRLEDAVRNVSGVASAGSFGGTGEYFNIRGFNNFTPTARNGFLFRDSLGFLAETANIERVEVIKGPASFLAGRIEPGGFINIITRQPLEEPYYLIETSIGSYGFVRPRFDFSGPLTTDGSLLYRLNGVYEYSDGFRDYDQNAERFFIAPVLAWRISDNTTLTAELEYLNEERPFDRGIPAVGDEVADIPIDRILGEPDDVREVESLRVGYRLEHRFNEDWTVRNAFSFYSSDSFDFRAEPQELNESTGELTRLFRLNDDLTESYLLQTDLQGNFRTGSIEHRLLVGFDLGRETNVGIALGAPEGLTPSINIFNPVYDVIPRPERSDLTVVGFNSSSRTDSLGVLLQDQIAFSDQFKVLIGGRFDIVDQESENLTSGIVSSQYDEAFSPRIGVIYQPIEALSLYASYSRSFTPNFGTLADGSLLEPQRATQYEIGVKADLLEDQLFATLALYDITRTNIPTTDPNNLDFVIPAGEVRSQGIELDLSGEILPGWNVIASYGYNDARVTESNNLPEELRFFNVPRHTASLWTTYFIQSGDLEGLGFGAGIFYVGERPGDFDNTFELPSYLRTDAAIYYRRGNWRAALNFKNLFNVRHFTSTDFGRPTIQPGALFTVIGSVSVEF
nr:TonB-dependent receptor [Gloeocapsopsis dulcis]